MRLMFSCAPTHATSPAFTFLYCFSVIGRPLRKTSVKKTTREAIITPLGPDKARHCQSARLDTRLRPSPAERKERCCSEETHTFPCHSAFPPLLFPVSGKSRRVKTLVAEFSLVCPPLVLLTDQRRTPCFNLSSYAATRVSGRFLLFMAQATVAGEHSGDFWCRLN